ncbi:SH3 domain-containing protein [Devosia lacusdianchii]|uniref:SH3 domain-containing protein n=1 Tax=Devosia lacusdianchii TaxID=2917991 RepID=UPI001F05104A|nr:SH3 domain-containing protein [Devosia sp. JXJ CY 41]
MIDKLHIRLAGIDAPELDHPFGQQSKWAMVKLCRGQVATARIKPEMSYDRVVAECFLPDGRDLAAELVRAGLALDWPKFSGGKYRHLEPVDARKKLWRAKLRQGGVMWPVDDPVLVRTPLDVQGYQPRPLALPSLAAAAGRVFRPRYRLGWIAASGLLALLAGCHFVGSTPQRMPASVTQAAPPLPSVQVTASALNVREQPAGNSRVLARIVQGTTITPIRMSGNWYAVGTRDGGVGWVHRDYLKPVGQ